MTARKDFRLQGLASVPPKLIHLESVLWCLHEFWSDGVSTMRTVVVRSRLELTLRGHPAQCAQYRRPPSFEATARSEPWPADVGTWSRWKVRSQQPRNATAQIWTPSLASLHPRRSTVAMTMSSNSSVRGTDAPSTTSTLPPSQVHDGRESGLFRYQHSRADRCSPAGPPASTLLPGNLPGTSSWACTCKQVSLTPGTWTRASSAAPPKPFGKQGASPWTVSSAQPGSNWSSATGRLALTPGASGRRFPKNVAPPHQMSALRFPVFRRAQRLLGSTGPNLFWGSQGQLGSRSFTAAAGHTCITRTLAGKLESHLRAANTRITRSSLLGATLAKHWTATSLNIASSTSRHAVTTLAATRVHDQVFPSSLSHEDDCVEFTHQVAWNHPLPM